MSAVIEKLLAHGIKRHVIGQIPWYCQGFEGLLYLATGNPPILQSAAAIAYGKAQQQSTTSSVLP